MLIALQILLHAFSQRTGPLPVDDPDTGEMCECSVVNKFIQFHAGLVHRHAEQVDLGGRCL